MKVEFGAIRLKRRSAVVAKSNWKDRFNVLSSTVSSETCSRFVDVGKVDIGTGCDGAEMMRQSDHKGK